MKTNTPFKIFTLVLLFLSALSLYGKKVKELIEVTEKKEKTSDRAVDKLFVAQSDAKKDALQTKASESSKMIPVTVVKNDTTKPLATKSDASIKVTHLDAKKEEKRSPRSIGICNGITKNMITYHYLGERVPSQFSVSFNNRPVIKLQEEKICTLDTSRIVMNQDDTLHVTFSYQFDVKGIVYHKGTKEITYKVPANLNEITPTFDWKKPEKVLIAQAELVTFRDL